MQCSRQQLTPSPLHARHGAGGATQTSILVYERTWAADRVMLPMDVPGDDSMTFEAIFNKHLKDNPV